MTTFLIDAGHGGIVDGKYVTPGKRSPKFDDGSQLFEGVYNRQIAKKIISLCTENGIPHVEICVAEQTDISLSDRVRRANDFYKTSSKNCVYISLHGDAAGDGVNWHQASGISVYTSPGQTKSDIFASLAIDELQLKFGSEVRWRFDNTDKDEDKEENFYVLRETLMPAVLGEHGFMTNKEEATKMLTDAWQCKVAEAYLEAMKKWNKLNS